MTLTHQQRVNMYVSTYLHRQEWQEHKLEQFLHNYYFYDVIKDADWASLTLVKAGDKYTHKASEVPPNALFGENTINLFAVIYVSPIIIDTKKQLSGS